MEFITTIDPAGRVVIPKAVREALRLDGGARLRLVSNYRSIVLEPIEEEPVLVVRDGMTLIGGELSGRERDYPVEAREARLGELTRRVTPRR